MSGAIIDGVTIQRGRRRVYGKDFKLQMVRRIAQGMPSSQLAREFGVSSSVMGKWLREWRKDPVHAFRGYGRRKPYQEQVERLRRTIKKLRAERDLLKKASARLTMNRDMCSDSSQSIEQYGRLDGCARFSVSRIADITIG